jgi:hypothetical protein
MRILAVLLLVIFVAGAASAQENPCSVVAEVVNLDPASFPDKASAEHALVLQRQNLAFVSRQPFPLDADESGWGYVGPGWGFVPQPVWTGVQNLSKGDFFARDRRRPVSVLSAQPDRSPRRVAFVAESGSEMNPAAREMEAVALSSILSIARPQDSFALLTAGEPHLTLPFGSNREALLEAAQGLAHSQRGTPRMEDLGRALVEASAWFGTPQAGDSLFLVAQTLNSTFERWVPEVRSALKARRIRLFALGLGPMVAPLSDCGADSGCWESAFAPLSEATGGGWEQFPKLPRTGGATQSNLWLARKRAEGLYEVAQALYFLRLERTGPDMKIYLSPHALHEMPWAHVFYPTPLPVCPPPGRNGSTGGKTK